MAPVTTSRDDIENAAKNLRQAAATGTPCAPIRSLISPDDLDAAYAIQQTNVELALSAGRQLSGRKIGLTSLAVQQQLGVDQPDFGALFADMEFGDNDEVPWSRVMQPKAEAEVALILDRDLHQEQPTLAQVINAVGYVVPAIEIVGSRIANWDIRIVDTIADNASSGVYVLGGPARRIDGLDLRTCGMTMTRNGTRVSEGTGAACLGNPLHAAVWLARRMARLGSPLRAGDLIMTGALGPMAPVQPGDVVEVEISGLGSVRARFGADGGNLSEEHISVSSAL